MTSKTINERKNTEELKTAHQQDFDRLVDATNLACPLPLLKMKQALNSAKNGEVILVKATDSASLRDFQTYIAMTEHSMTFELVDQCYWYWITK